MRSVPTCCAHWDLSSMGWHLAGLVRAWAWATLYAWVASWLMSQALVVEAPRNWAATWNPPIPHARSACVQGRSARLGSSVFQTRPDGAMRILITAAQDPGWLTWKS